MNEREMTMLVERAGTRLQPDVETLVAGGVSRGRTRRRRRRAGSAIASLAVVGAVAALLGSVLSGGAGTAPVADEATPASSSSTPAPARTPIDRAAVPAAFASLFGGTVSGPLAGEGAVTDFRWEGYRVRVVIAAAVPDLDPMERCAADSGQPNCLVLADGTAVPQLSRLDERLARGYRDTEGYTSDGFDVSIMIRNASGSKSGSIQSRRDELDLIAAVASDVWFD